MKPRVYLMPDPNSVTQQPVPVYPGRNQGKPKAKRTFTGLAGSPLATVNTVEQNPKPKLETITSSELHHLLEKQRRKEKINPRGKRLFRLLTKRGVGARRRSTCFGFGAWPRSFTWPEVSAVRIPPSYNGTSQCAF